MVGNLSMPQDVTFFPQYIPRDRPNHNDPIHLELFIHKAKVKRVLIDGGAGLNICTLKVIKGLGYSKEDEDPSCRIMIKFYDDGEGFSKGVIILPFRVGPTTKNTLFQVIDIEMNYNMILGHPCINVAKEIPSTYHQCLKFSYKSVEVTISSDLNPFQFCASLRETIAYQVPINRESKPLDSSKYVDPTKLTTTSKGMLKIEDQICSEYFMSQVFHIGKLPLSPKSYFKPQIIQIRQSKFTL